MTWQDVASEMLVQMHPDLWDNPAFEEGVGSVRPGEGWLLYGLVRALRPAWILEVGTGYGFSTLHLAAGCHDNGHGTVFSIEPEPGRRQAAQNWLRKGGVAQWAVLCATWPNLVYVDLAFFDAVHTAQAVASYFAAVELLLVQEAVVVVHNGCHEDHAAKALEIAGFDDQWTVLRLPGTSKGGLAVLARKARIEE